MTNTPSRYGIALDEKSLMSWLMENSEDNAETMARAKRNLARAIEEELTPAQRTCLQMYYFDRKTMQEIGDELGVDRTTVSRNVQRGCRRLYRVLSYSF